MGITDNSTCAQGKATNELPSKTKGVAWGTGWVSSQCKSRLKVEKMIPAVFDMTVQQEIEG